MNKLTPTEAAYIAGIIDGEGCIGVRADKDHIVSMCRIHIGNTSMALIDYITKTLGGGILEADNHHLKNDKWNQVFRFIIYKHQDIINLLEQIMDYLIVKKRQAQLMIDIIK